MRRDGDTLVLEGAVTLDTVPGLADAAGGHIRDGVVAVDFSGVTEVDSAAVALALEWLRVARRAGVELRLVELPASMLNLATLYGVAELLEPGAPA